MKKVIIFPIAVSLLVSVPFSAFSANKSLEQISKENEQINIAIAYREEARERNAKRHLIAQTFRRINQQRRAKNLQRRYNAVNKEKIRTG